MKLSFAFALVVALVAAAFDVFAAGPAASAPGSAASMPCAASGPGGCGPGRYGMRHGARWGQGYTSGWTMMSADERSQHADMMRSFQSYEDCKAYVDQHHQQMVTRAKDKGVTMPALPRHDPCAGLKPAKK